MSFKSYIEDISKFVSSFQTDSKYNCVSLFIFSDTPQVSQLHFNIDGNLVYSNNLIRIDDTISDLSKDLLGYNTILCIGYTGNKYPISHLVQSLHLVDKIEKSKLQTLMRLGPGIEVYYLNVKGLSLPIIEFIAGMGLSYQLLNNNNDWLTYSKVSEYLKK